MMSQHFWSILVLVLASLSLLASQTGAFQETRQQWAISRKSIVFDLKTPKVFYCPQSKQAEQDKMIVKSVPLEKLCEFQGEPKPRGLPSDCYGDLDETEMACDEKKRFMVRLEAVDSQEGSSNASGDSIGYKPDELEYFVHKKSTSGEKKTKALESKGNKKF